MSEPSENALDDMWANLFNCFASFESYGMTVSVIDSYVAPVASDIPPDQRHGFHWVHAVDHTVAVDVPRDASAIHTARQTARAGLVAIGHTAEAGTPSVALQERRRKRTRSECYPFPDYR